MRFEHGAIREAPIIAKRARAHPDESPQVFTRGMGAAPPRVGGRPRIVVARSLDELKEHRLALDDLAADSLERNVFYESILAEPAVRS
ncbi:MAG: hypothetical protein ACREK4_23740, partial [Candidatus Rokuibacteriota bacterium]